MVEEDDIQNAHRDIISLRTMNSYRGDSRIATVFEICSRQTKCKLNIYFYLSKPCMNSDLSRFVKREVKQEDRN